MAHVIALDEFITDEWYPGFKPAFDHAPFYVEPFRTFSREDESRFWFLDFHWPRGLTPLGLIWNEDGYAWGTQFAAENLPLPPGRGIGVRMAGIHTYASPVDVASPVQIGERAQRMGPRLGHFLENFDDIWAERRDEVERGWQHFVAQDTSAMSLPELAGMLTDARAFHKRAFEIHFEVMYPMLVNYLGFYGLCGDIGVDQSQIGKFLQGYDTKIMETDRELGRLAKAARSAGLQDVFTSTADGELGASLDALGGAGSAWMTQFRDFLSVYGYRTEGSCDVALPSWIEDPTPALAMIKSFLLRPDEHDYEKARAEAIDEREAAIDDARSQLTKEEQEAFDAWPPVSGSTSPGGRTTTTTTSTSGYPCPCAGRLVRSPSASAASPTTVCSCSGPSSPRWPRARRTTRVSRASSRTASSTSSTGTRSGPPCPRCSGRCLMRSPTRS